MQLRLPRVVAAAGEEEETEMPSQAALDTPAAGSNRERISNVDA